MFRINKVTITLLCILLNFNVFAKTVYLVRHAEKQKGQDPSLTDDGQHRAEHLAYLLKDTHIKYIYSTEYKRTMQTAKPLLKKRGLELQFYDPRKLKDFAKKLKSLKGNALVVGHSNTTVELAALLSGQRLTGMQEDAYGDVYQVTFASDTAAVQHLNIPPVLNTQKAKVKDLHEIVNFIKFSDRIQTSGQPPAQVLKKLSDHQYDLVINLAPPQSQGSVIEEADFIASQGVSYINIPVDWHDPTVRDFNLFSQLLNSKDVSKALVHCQMNMRASAFTFLYQVIHGGVKPQMAFEKMKEIWVPGDQWRDFILKTLQENNIDFSF